MLFTLFYWNRLLKPQFNINVIPFKGIRQISNLVPQFTSCVVNECVADVFYLCILKRKQLLILRSVFARIRCHKKVSVGVPCTLNFEIFEFFCSILWFQLFYFFKEKGNFDMILYFLIVSFLWGLWVSAI